MANNFIQKNHENISVADIENEDDAYFEELRKLRKPLYCSLQTSKISEDITISMSDDIKYLFQNDVMKFPKRINLELPEEKDSLSVRLSNGFTRFPRRAKLKQTSSINLIDDDLSDDDFPSLYQTNSKTQTKTKDFTVKNTRKTHLDESNDEVSSSAPKKPKTNNNNGSIFGAAKSIFKDFVIPKLSSRTTATTTNNESNNEKITVDSKKEKEIPCPMCSVTFSETEIEQHAFNCQGPKITRHRQPKVKESSVFNSATWTAEFDFQNGVANNKTKDNTKENKENNNKKTIDKNLLDSHFKVKDKENNVNSNFVRQQHQERKDLTNNKQKNPTIHKANAKLTASENPFMSDDDDPINDVVNELTAGYKNNTRKASPQRAYGRSHFDDSDSGELFNNGHMKCFRCQKEFPINDGMYKTHVTECLNESKIDNSYT